MSKPGDVLVRCCNKLNRLPSLILCFVLILIQDVCVNYYLIHHLALAHLAWAAPDLVVLILVIVCFRLTAPSHFDDELNIDHSWTYMLVWVTWVLMQSCLGAKVIVISFTFATELGEEHTFFGPNTLKTCIALGSCIFVLLITSQHNAPPSSERRRYIDELTGTVVFDILDTADILEILFDAEDRPGLSTGLPEAVLFVAVLNLLLPTVPLITLSRTKFGNEKLSKTMVHIHRLLLVLVVNVPNLVVRLALWHADSVAISPFTLKNIILICMTAYEFYEHKKMKFEMHEEEKECELQEHGDIGELNGKPERKEYHDDKDYKDNKKDKDDIDGAKHLHRRPKSYVSSGENGNGVHFDIENRVMPSDI